MIFLKILFLKSMNKIIMSLRKNRYPQLNMIKLIVLGGLGYTGGVPFFVRNTNFDHSIWHIFVMVGSVSHWLAVYYYVLPMDGKF